VHRSPSRRSRCRSRQPAALDADVYTQYARTTRGAASPSRPCLTPRIGGPDISSIRQSRESSAATDTRLIRDHILAKPGHEQAEDGLLVFAEGRWRVASTVVCGEAADTSGPRCAECTATAVVWLIAGSRGPAGYRGCADVADSGRRPWSGRRRVASRLPREPPGGRWTSARLPRRAGLARPERHWEDRATRLCIPTQGQIRRSRRLRSASGGSAWQPPWTGARWCGMLRLACSSRTYIGRS
jgi:hypothetical protein